MARELAALGFGRNSKSGRKLDNGEVGRLQAWAVRGCGPGRL
jgi:hypothetical protein